MVGRIAGRRGETGVLTETEPSAGGEGFGPVQDGPFCYPVGSEPGAPCGSTVCRLSLRPLLPDEDA
jgi:hypothetical protein